MPNVLTAYSPEMWSRKSVALLREKTRMPRVVRVDFSEDLQQAGDTVNTRKKAKMTAETVNPTTGVAAQDAEATNIQVVLNQHKHVTFKIPDVDASKSFINLVDEFLDPAMLAIANAVDISLLGLYSDVTEQVNVSSAADWRTAFNSARTALNRQLAPENGRVMVLSDDDEGDVSNLDLLTQVNTSGSSTTLREGTIGRYKGFDVMRATNVVSAGSPAYRFNMGFYPDAFGLVTRVLRPAAGITPGAVQKSAIDPDAGLSVRVTMSYNATLLATQVTCDILYGVKTLDEELAVLLAAGY